ncbi:hypothetical protein BH11ACT8_BH11ACT8_32040 [soil metagenome]
MGQAGVPSDLTPLKEPLIEAVTNAYMAKLVPSTGPFEYAEGSCQEGEFRYKHSRFGLDDKVYCSYPDGQWKVDQLLDPDDDRSPGDHVGDELTLFDAAAKFQEIREEVSKWVDPWIACADPNEFTAELQALASIIDQLYVQGEVRLGGNPVAGGDSSGTTSMPVTDVQSAIADMGSELSSLNGLAIDALERAYVNDVGLTISGQRALAAVAGLAVAGEAEAWSRAYANLTEFITKATHDFEVFSGVDQEEGDGGKTALTVVSGAATAAAAATFEFPPAAVTFGVIAGLAAIGSAFWPGGEESAPATLIALEGGDFGAVWESFGLGIRGIDSELTQAEYSLAMMCRNAIADLSTHPDSFSITAKGPGGVPQAGDNLPRFLNTEGDSAPIELYAGDDITIVHHKLKTVAGLVEHVGNHQRTVAGSLGAADSDAGWSRGTLQGTVIGWGPTGHHADTSVVLDTLTDLLLTESRTAHRVAEQCLDISTGFRLTDDQIEARLDLLEQGVGG